LGGPPIPEKLLPWYRFAAVCVLYNVPTKLEEAVKFADYGGLPTVPTTAEEEQPVLRMWSGRELEEQRMRGAVWIAQDEFVAEKAWELHSEFAGLNRRAAELAVWSRFHAQLEEIEKWVSREYKLTMEYDPPRQYQIEFIPEEHTDDDIKNTVRAIRHQAEATAPQGRKPHDNLLRVLCEIELQNGRPIEVLAAMIGITSMRVKQLAAEGRELLKSDS
jgi:hypothetical protein